MSNRVVPHFTDGRCRTSICGAGEPPTESALVEIPLLWLAHRALVAFCIATGIAIAVSASALAARTEQSEITEANGSRLIKPTGLAVDGADNVWVSDLRTGGVVDKYSATGGFLTESSGTPWSGEYIESIAFDHAVELLYVADSNADDVWGLESSAAYAGIDLKGPWGSGCCFIRVAADNSAGPTGGDLYVSGEGSSVYRVDGGGKEAAFSAAEEYIEGDRLTGYASGEAFSSPSGLAVDSGGDLYVADAVRDAVYEFEPSGKFLRAFTEAEGHSLGAVSAVAIDPTNGHVLVADPTNGVVDEFTAVGAYLDNVEEVGTPQGLAVDSTGRVYVADSQAAVVRVFGSFSPPTHLPRIVYSPTSSLTASSVTVNGNINPKGGGEVSECRFEYGLDTSYGHSVTCSPAGFSSSTSVSAALSGLQPDLVYHYRIHVVDPMTGPAGSNGLDHSFATNPTFGATASEKCANLGHAAQSARLPDCRAYELLTPGDKGTAEDMFGDIGEQSVSGGTFDVGYPSQDGSAFFLTTVAAFGPFPASGQNGYVFSRGSSGWGETSLASPMFGVQSLIPAILSPDFAHVAVEDKLGSQADLATGRELGLLGAPGGPYTTLFDTPRESGVGEFAGISSDFSHVIFQSREHSLAAPASEQLAGSHALYEYFGGHYSVVNVNNEGAPLDPCGAVSPAASTAVGKYAHAVSADGSRVFFLSPDRSDASCYEESPSGFTGSPPQLYLRAAGHTTLISEPEGGVVDPNGPQPVAFAGAAADGSRVLLVTRSELTADDLGNHAPELYEYDVETRALRRVSRGVSGHGVGNVGWVVASEDGSTVYFTATGSLAPGAPVLAHGGGEFGEYNLYRFDTKTASYAFIATVSGHDWNGAFAEGAVTLNIRNPINVRSEWETTPNGRYLLFAAVEGLTGYDNLDPTGHCHGDISGNGEGPENRCSEVYRYDNVAGSLICVSCDPSGAPPSANARFDRNVHYRAARAISDDGQYAFFDTADPLTTTDTNGRLDVYEWHGGELFPISSGQDASNSYFLGIDPSGANVFFGTHARLTSRDTDAAGDLYDARIGGGFPPTQGSVACEGGACQSVAAPPSDLTPMSLTFSGPSNVPVAAHLTKPPSKKCKKGFVKKHGRCVKVKKRKKSKATAQKDSPKSRRRG